MRNPRIQPILEELSARLRARYGARFEGLWLYGSQARGDAGPESDVDLLLLLRQPERPAVEIDRIADILAHLNLEHGVLLSVLPVDAATVQQGSGPFWERVREEGMAA